MLAMLPGPDHTLTASDVPTPELPPTAVRIAVAAVGVNRADLLQIRGVYPPPPGTPPWPGLEVSGTITAIGSAVAAPTSPASTSPAATTASSVTTPSESRILPLTLGTPVCALLSGGGYATEVVVDARHVLPLPAGIDLVAGAALPEAACTNWWNLVMRAKLTGGQSVLIRGASGGIGSLGVQIATALGTQVSATAGGPHRTALLKTLARTATVLNHHTPLAPQLETGHRGFDVILDVLGAGGLTENLALLAPEGKLVIIGLQKGTRGQMHLPELLAGAKWVTGSLLRPQPAAVKANIVAAVSKHVWPMLTAGQVRPVIAQTHHLTQATTALAALASGEVFGKLVLTT